MSDGRFFINAVAGSPVDDVMPLAQLFDVELDEGKVVSRVDAEMIWDELSYCGANNIAYVLRGFEGVDYTEIVRDVCKHLKLDAIGGDSVEAVRRNEEQVIRRLFSDAWDQMDPEERRELLEGMDLDPKDGFATKSAAAVMGQIGARTAGFATYRLSVVAANWVARAVVGRGLALGANAALTRGIGIALGPVGLTISGAWLLHDLASPALRKTMPAVVIAAALRQARDHAKEERRATETRRAVQKKRATAKKSEPRPAEPNVRVAQSAQRRRRKAAKEK